jgi:hypothetical protein
MNIRRAVQRNDDFIEVRDYRLGVLFEKQSGAQHRQPHAERAQPRAQPEQIGVHERLTAREDDPAHSQRFHIGRVAVEINKEVPDHPLRFLHLSLVVEASLAFWVVVFEILL